MKTFFKKIGGVVGLALLCALPASAQNGFNAFEQFRTLIVAPQTLKSGSDVGLVTNNAVDIHGFEGVASLLLNVATNVAGGTLTCTVETSPDKTNWTAISTYALTTAATVIYTNLTWPVLPGTNALTATNVYFLPGTITTPTASTAGFATQYLLPAPFTNSAAVNVITANGFTEIGFNIQDLSRYLHVIWTPGGTVTNYVASAVLKARKQQFP